MREIYTSPRPKNIDMVVKLFAQHGIETRITNRAVYERSSFVNFSYAPGQENRADWPRVEVKYARDMTRARELLRQAGIAPLTRYAEELELSRQPRRRRSPMQVATRLRSILLTVLVVAIVIAVMKSYGLI
ncbi:MAG TPA: DUF2007 domain-containing protein [Rhodanobacteraceae bacterium]